VKNEEIAGNADWEDEDEGKLTGDGLSESGSQQHGFK
jgi:hypothetical protein